VHVPTGQEEEWGLIATSAGFGSTCRFTEIPRPHLLADGQESAAFIRQSTW
jgi:hypothetical protein